MKEDLFNPVVLPGVLWAAAHTRGMERNHNDSDCGLKKKKEKKPELFSYSCLDMIYTFRHLGTFFFV